MIQVIINNFVLLLGFFIFILGTSFVSTFIILKMHVYNIISLIIGMMTGVFYGGLICGSLFMEKFIIKIGYIQSYSIFSSIFSIICLLHGTFYSTWIWLLLRFLSGVISSGLFIVIESILLFQSTSKNRGRVISLYMIIFYGAQSISQFFLIFGNIQSTILFSLSSILCSLSVIPINIYNMDFIKHTIFSSLKLRILMNKTIYGCLGCLGSGLILGSIYGFFPIYLDNIFHTKAKIAKYMFSVIFGGMLLQYPIGKISDIFNKKLVLVLILIILIIMSYLLLIKNNGICMFVIFLLFGGIIFSLYPISIGYVFEKLETKNFISGTQNLLLIYSIGAMIGPIISSMYVKIFGIRGIFIYCISICIIILSLQNFFKK